jgi:hypothetical protein
MAPLKNTVEDMKIRFGWGITGNDNIAWYSWRGRVSAGANYPIGGVILPGNYQSSIENRNLQWETTEQYNFGIDVTVLNGRVNFTADAYVKNTSDLLLNVQLPRTTGFNEGILNIGKLQNKGLEFLVTTRNLVDEIKWETDFNISFNRNEVIDVNGQTIVAGGVAGRGDVSWSQEGSPLGLFYGYVFGGVDPATGDAYYIDKDGESTFTPAADDRRIIGDPNADFIYGMTNTVSYKNFQLSMFLQGVSGNDVFNATRIETEGMTDAKNQSAVVTDRWRQPGDATDIPRAVWGNTNNSRLSTRFVEDGSFLRVKALTLSYNIPSSILSKAKMSNAKVYVTGENLLTFTGYKGYDPEVNAFGGGDSSDDNVALGVDYGTYPHTRNLIFGVNLSF